MNQQLPVIVNPAKPGDKPPLSDASKKRIDHVSHTFYTDLHSVAETIAKNAPAEYILVSHVDEALLVFRRNGLRKPRGFFSRPDFKVGAGAALFGAAPAISSFAKDIIELNGPIKDQPVMMWLFMIVVPFLVFGIGIALACIGWMQNETA